MHFYGEQPTAPVKLMDPRAGYGGGAATPIGKRESRFGMVFVAACLISFNHAECV
jgi:hypothetical protein